MSRLITTPLVQQAYRVATRSRARTLPTDVLADLDPNGVHVLTTSMIVDDSMFVRVTGMFKMSDTDTPQGGILDVPLEMFNKLPTHAEVADA